jgi:flagellar biosynthetic protein FliR
MTTAVITTQQIYDLIGVYLWPFCRIGSLFMVMALIGTKMIPVRTRLVFALSITVAVAPMLPEAQSFELISPQAYIVVLQQLIIGAVIGILSHVILQSFVLGGQILAMQSGLGFAQMMDPTSGVTVPIVSQFFLMTASLIFLSLDGHVYMLQMIIHSFHTLPVGTWGVEPENYFELVLFAKGMFASALMMAMAAVAALLLINISFGITTKAAPQLNIFAIGFPVTIMAGLLIAWVSLGQMLPRFLQHWEAGRQMMCQLLNMSC